MQMSGENTFLLGLLLFWGIIYISSLVLHGDKYGFKILPFFLSYRSEKFKNTILKIGEKNKLLWKTSSNIGIALALGLIVFVTYFLFSNLLKFFYPLGERVPVMPVVPAITIRLDSLPYFFGAVAVVVFLHELAHGVIAAVERVSVKSAGLAFMLAFFGGFVEPNEKDFENASRTSKLRILGAGSAANLVTGLFVLLLLMGLFAPSIGVLVNGTVENGPLERAGVKRYDVIYAINDTEIDSLQSLANYLANTKPGSLLVLRINEGYVSVITENSSGRAIIGLSHGLNYYPCRFGLDRVASVNIYLFLDWVFIITFSIAVFNMLPAFPFDGEKFFYYFFECYVRKERKFSFRVLVNVVFWSLLLANMILSFWWFGLPSV